jgi:hypothetical protein
LIGNVLHSLTGKQFVPFITICRFAAESRAARSQARVLVCGLLLFLSPLTAEEERDWRTAIILYARYASEGLSGPVADVGARETDCSVRARQGQSPRRGQQRQDTHDEGEAHVQQSCVRLSPLIALAG